MIKRFCDRCGAETVTTNIRVPDKKTKTEFWLKKFCDDSVFHTKADLCENCVKSFKNWFMESR